MNKLIILFAFTLTIIIGCKKNDNPIDPADEIISITGKVVLPSNSGININGLEVNSGFSSQILATDTFKVEVLKNDFSCQYLKNAQGRNILIGYSYPGQTDFTINSKSTLLGMLMQAPTVTSLTTDAKLNFINKIKTSLQLPTALSNLENAIRAGKDIFDTLNTSLHSSIFNLFESVTSTASTGLAEQVLINVDGKTIEVTNPGITYTQCIGIYKNNIRLGQVDLDRCKIFASSVQGVAIQALQTNIIPTSISKKITVQEDGIYTLKIRNGGLRSWNGDYESTDARFQNLYQQTTDLVSVFVKIKGCPGTIITATKEASQYYKDAINGQTSNIQFFKTVYDCGQLVIKSLKGATDCAGFQETKIQSYLSSIEKSLPFLKFVSIVGAVMNTSVFGVQYFYFPSSKDTSVVIGNPIVGSWKIVGVTWCGIDQWALAYNQSVLTTCGYYLGGSPACRKDDITIFRKDMTMETNEGATSCNPATPPTFGTYTIIGKILSTSTSMDTWEIIQNDAVTLKLKIANSSDGVIKTFQRQ